MLFRSVSQSRYTKARESDSSFMVSREEIKGNAPAQNFQYDMTRRNESSGNIKSLDPGTNSDDGEDLNDIMYATSGLDAERRQKRLERNRAAARLRRQKKKNITDMLRQEVYDLQRSITFLKVLSEYRKVSVPSSSLNYPLPILKDAYKASMQAPSGLTEELDQIENITGTRLS